MKYVALFDPTGLRLSEIFWTESEAQRWLDSYNNNCEFDSIINIFDDNGKLIDGYFYTRAAR